MWEHIVEGEIEVGWVRDALANGTFLAVTDGSYDREKAPTVSGSGWIIVCTVCHRTLRGSFFEVSHLQETLSVISCDNMAALNQARKNRKRVGIGVKHSDLHRTIRTLKHLA